MSVRKSVVISLAIYPLSFQAFNVINMRGQSSDACAKGRIDCEDSPRLHNSNFSAAEYKSTRFPWMVYGVWGCQEFLSACSAAGAPFNVVLVSNPNEYARTLTRIHSSYPCILEDLGKLLLANAFDVKSNVVGYIMHVPPDEDRVLYANVWRFQEALINSCRLYRDLIICLVHLASASPPNLVAKFVKTIRTKGWTVKRLELSLPQFGDSFTATRISCSATVTQ